MSIAITLTLPAILTPQVLALTALTCGTIAIGYGAYKLIQKYRKGSNVVSSNNDSVKTKIKRKAKLIFQVCLAKVQHHWLMLAGSMPQWMFYIVGKCTSATAGATIRRSVAHASIPVYLVGTLLGAVVEVGGDLATGVTTVFHPHAVAYRMEYKERMKAIRTVNS